MISYIRAWTPLVCHGKPLTSHTTAGLRLFSSWCELFIEPLQPLLRHGFGQARISLEGWDSTPELGTTWYNLLTFVLLVWGSLLTSIMTRHKMQPFYSNVVPDLVGCLPFAYRNYSYALLVGVRILKFSLVHHIAIILRFPAFSAANCRSSLHSALQSSSSPEPCPGPTMPRAQLLESPQVESNFWEAQSHDSSFLWLIFPTFPTSIP